MIGPYSQFKGKLKVGDRVRDSHGIFSTVRSSNHNGFILDHDDGAGYFYRWTSEGTLELLPPSPRVVTLENLEAGDELEHSYGCPNFKVVDRGAVTGLTLVTIPGSKDPRIEVWSEDEFREIGWQPIQPASPPAPAEKEEEWWEGHFNRHFPNPEDSWIKTWAHFLVDEAKRRGAEEAWKEAKCIIEAQKKYRGIISTAGGDFILLVRLVEAIDAKLESLNKPAGAGEK